MVLEMLRGESDMACPPWWAAVGLPTALNRTYVRACGAQCGAPLPGGRRPAARWPRPPGLERRHLAVAEMLPNPADEEAPVSGPLPVVERRQLPAGSRERDQDRPDPGGPSRFAVLCRAQRHQRNPPSAQRKATAPSGNAAPSRAQSITIGASPSSTINRHIARSDTTPITASKRREFDEA